MQDSLQITHIEYSMNTRSLDVFTIGCNGNCKGCCNPEIKSWDLKGISVTDTLGKLTELNSKFNKLISRIFIVGGDTCDAYIYYPDDVKILLEKIKTDIKKPIYFFTRHSIDEVPDDIKNMVDYIKTGAYMPELTTDDNIQHGIKLATSNQIIYKKENKRWKK